MDKGHGLNMFFIQRTLNQSKKNFVMDKSDHITMSSPETLLITSEIEMLELGSIGQMIQP